MPYKKLKCSYCGKIFLRSSSNIRKNNKTQFCSNKCMSKYRTGKNNPCYIGSKGLIECVICGKKFEIFRNKKESNRRKACSMECRNIYISIYQKENTIFKKWLGENHPNWQGGKSFEEYGQEFDNALKERVRFRDKYKCQCCGCTQLENGRQLDIHHIDYNKKNNKEWNLIALCHSCHMKTNYKRKYWKNLFQEVINAICINRPSTRLCKKENKKQEKTSPMGSGI